MNRAIPENDFQQTLKNQNLETSTKKQIQYLLYDLFV